MSKVLCFGSLNIDYVYQVDHFVSKGETLSSQSMQVFSGGKGLNQAVALGKAGAQAYMAGQIGTDGEFLMNALHEAMVDTSHVKICQDINSGNAIIQRDINGDNCILLYAGANKKIHRDFVDNVLRHFKSGDWIVLQNEINELEYIITQAHERGMVTVLNPSPLNESITEEVCHKADWVLLNEVEAMQMTGVSMEQRNRLFFEITKKLPHSKVVLTMGVEGSYYLNNVPVIHQDIFPVQTVDTTAAGDTFTGYFISAIIEGLQVSKSLQMAAKAASIAVSRAGAAPSIPFRYEL